MERREPFIDNRTTPAAAALRLGASEGGPRMKRRPRGVWLVLTASFGACGDGPTEPRVTVTITEPAAAELIVGDALGLAATASDPLATVQWGSSNDLVAAVIADSVVAQRPGTVELTARAGDGSASVALTVLPRDGGYTAEEVDYFLEIALGWDFTFGDVGPSQIVRKWARDVTFHVHGTPTDADRVMLDDVVSDINALTSEVDLIEVDGPAPVDLYFRDNSTFGQILPGTDGFSGAWSVSWATTEHMDRAVVLMATNIDQPPRNHLLRLYMTIMLGMGKRSFRYTNSIFQTFFSTATSTLTEFAPIDEAVIEILYRPELIVGMDKAAAGRAARLLIRGVVEPVPRPVGPHASPPSPGRPGSGAGSVRAVGGSGGTSRLPLSAGPVR